MKVMSGWDGTWVVLIEGAYKKRVCMGSFDLVWGNIQFFLIAEGVVPEPLVDLSCTVY